MADPVTATIAAGLIGAGATLLSAAAGGTIAVANLAYNIHKDRKSVKDKEAANLADARNSYDPNVVYQPSASYQKSGTEKVSFSPDGRFSAVGTSTSDWSCGTITYYATREQGGATGKQKKRGSLFGNNAGPPPYR